jgi:DNA polymerase I-like protein with 3'-5' exonuclease and polymerase domains
MLISLDTETTGLDLHHGCKPFFVSAYDDEGNPYSWEWEINPKTREPRIPKRELRELQTFVDDATKLVLHNAKFDMRALSRIGIRIPSWKKIHDTLIAHHCLASKKSHKLKDLGIDLLDIDDTDQDDLREAVNAARRIGDRKGWRIAKSYDPHWPAMKKPPKNKKEGSDAWWPLDMWLPRQIAIADKYPDNHEWHTVCRQYAMRDAERTLALWYILREALEEEGLWKQYLVRRKLLPVTYRMEERGITTRVSKLTAATEQYKTEAETTERKCFKLADRKIDNLRSPLQLQGIMFGHFRLKPMKETKEGYSTDKDVVDHLLETTPRNAKAWHFLNNLKYHRKYSTAGRYLKSYELSGIPIRGCDDASQLDWDRAVSQWHEFLRLHANFNITGTDTTRLSSSNPNAQNISKKEGFNLRQVFGPLPGRRWYSLDYSNIELRIFAYASGDKDLIKAFETGYSVHLLVCQALYPKEFAECERKGLDFKKVYESTLYQWVKNGNFSLIYGAGMKKADATYHLPGAYKKIRKRFKAIDRFMTAKHEEAVQKGFVTCIGGYRLYVSKREPHKAVNYFVQGSAGWAMCLAMIEADDYLESLEEDAYLCMTIHDELDMDTPDNDEHNGTAYQVKLRMEKSGNALGFPTPVDVDLIRDNWASEEKVKFSIAA